ncbi:hypothetical protein D3C87_1147600 [compost metagenome]
MGVDIERLGQARLVPIELLIEKLLGEMHDLARILVHHEGNHVGVRESVGADDKTFGVHVVLIRVHQGVAHWNNGFFDFIDQLRVNAGDVKEALEEGIQAGASHKRSGFRKVMQAVERIKARHIDGLHDLARPVRLQQANGGHAPRFNVQRSVDFMAGRILVVHLRQGLAEVHGVRIQVHHLLPAWRLQQGRSCLAGIVQLQDRARFVDAVDFSGDSGELMFADRVEERAFTWLAGQIFQGNIWGFEGLLQRAHRRCRLDFLPLRGFYGPRHRCGFSRHRGIFNGAFQRQPSQRDQLHGTGDKFLQCPFPVVILQILSGGLGIFEALPQELRVGQFTGQQAGNPFDSGAEQVDYRAPVRLGRRRRQTVQQVL